MKLVVGLGNPGPRYSGTRHNVGFDVIAALAVARSGPWRSSKFEAQLAEVLVNDRRVLLAAPQTFMNLSGRSVRSLITFYKIPLPDLLIVCDDINLPTGRLRLRASGSAGGQKGLTNIIDQLGSSEFARLRIGVGRPPETLGSATYVLQRFSKSERTTIDEAVREGVKAVQTWVCEGIEAAMNQFNAGDRSQEAED